MPFPRNPDAQNQYFMSRKNLARKTRFDKRMEYEQQAEERLPKNDKDHASDGTNLQGRIDNQGYDYIPFD